MLVGAIMSTTFVRCRHMGHLLRKGGIAADQLDAAGSVLSGQLAKGLTPGAEAFEQIGVENARPLLRAGHDEAVVVTQRPEAAEIGRAKRGRVFLHKDGFAGCGLQARAGGRIEALRPVVPDEAKLRILPGELQGDVGGRIGGAVIDDEDFEAAGQVGEQVKEPFDTFGKCALGIAHRKDKSERIFGHSLSFGRGGGAEVDGGWIGSQSVGLRLAVRRIGL